MKEDIGKNVDSENSQREEVSSFAEARKSYIKMLAKLLAAEILIEEGMIDENSTHLIEN